jgi:hypothetical protein
MSGIRHTETEVVDEAIVGFILQVRHVYREQAQVINCVAEHGLEDGLGEVQLGEGVVVMLGAVEAEAGAGVVVHALQAQRRFTAGAAGCGAVAPNLAPTALGASYGGPSPLVRRAGIHIASRRNGGRK